MRCVFLLLLGLVGLVLPQPLLSRTWYVNLDKTGDAPTIQAAIDSAAVGDTVLVAPGTYTRANQDMLDYFIVVAVYKEICLVSEAGPGGTILDAEGEVGVINVQSESGDITPIIEGFTITGGSVDFADIGAGIRCWYTSPIIRGNIITGNWAFQNGAGVGCWHSNATVANNIITCNTSATGMGAGVYLGYSEAAITNNTFIANAAGDGAGIGSYVSPSATISHNIIASSPLGSAVHCGAGSPTITCNDFWDNEGGEGNCTQGPDNFSADPMFCDPSAGNYHLHEDSPCTPDNSPAGCGLVGALPVGCWDTPLSLPGIALVMVGAGAIGVWGILRGRARSSR